MDIFPLRHVWIFKALQVHAECDNHTNYTEHASPDKYAGLKSNDVQHYTNGIWLHQSNPKLHHPRILVPPRNYYAGDANFKHAGSASKDFAGRATSDNYAGRASATTFDNAEHTSRICLTFLQQRCTLTGSLLHHHRPNWNFHLPQILPNRYRRRTSMESLFHRL